MKLSGLWLLSAVYAYTITLGFLRVNEKQITIGEVNTQQIQTLEIDGARDEIAVLVKLDETETPRQFVIQFLSVEHPEYLMQKVAKHGKNGGLVVLTAGQLPDAIKTGPIAVKVIVGLESGHTQRLLGQLVPSVEFIALVAHEPIIEFGEKPEIFHQFRGDPAMVNPLVPMAFMGAACALFVSLALGWLGVIGPEALMYQFKFISATELTFNASFLVILLLVQFNWYLYYAGQLIFDTLKYTLVLAVPAVFLGSKVLRFLKKAKANGRD